MIGREYKIAAQDVILGGGYVVLSLRFAECDRPWRTATLTLGFADHQNAMEGAAFILHLTPSSADSMLAWFRAVGRTPPEETTMTYCQPGSFARQDVLDGERSAELRAQCAEPGQVRVWIWDSTAQQAVYAFRVGRRKWRDVTTVAEDAIAVWRRTVDRLTARKETDGTDH